MIRANDTKIFKPKNAALYNSKMRTLDKRGKCMKEKVIETRGLVKQFGAKHLYFVLKWRIL
ncbi:MAG: hypothetical protein KAT49_06365 [Methanomicrobia archaeon]|nr:hypothetical protein [Methanomicrobia archaeon]